MEVAKRLGTSQSTISQVERGRLVVPELRRAMAALLGVEALVATVRGPRNLSLPKVLDEATPTTLCKATLWRSRDASGDWLDVVNVGADTLFVAGDVAGNGEELAPLANYMLGLVRGRLLHVGVPDLRALATELLDEGVERGITTTILLALLRRSRRNPLEAQLDVVRFGHPEPVVVTGPPFATPLSEQRTLSHEGSGLRGFQTTFTLVDPWRVVVASDGLLNRLGGRDEAAGRRVLYRWAQSKTRSAPITELVGRDEPRYEDESAMVIDGAAFTYEAVDFHPDDVVSLDVLKVVQTELRTEAEELRERVGAGAMEALNNVHHHSGAGTATLRLRVGAQRVLVEVSDEGTGMPKTQKKSGGIAAMKAHADEIWIESNHPSGTRVTLIFNREPRS